MKMKSRLSVPEGLSPPAMHFVIENACIPPFELKMRTEDNLLIFIDQQEGNNNQKLW